MISLQIEDNRDFTAKLLLGSVFDKFLISGGTIVTGTTVTIDGRLNVNFYDKDALTDEDGLPRVYASWAEIRPLAFERIKGKRLPLSFQFVLLADRKETAALLSQQPDQPVVPEQIAGLFLNIRFDGNTIACSTGVSLHTFSLDKTVEHLWDNRILSFFRENRLAFSQLS